MPLNRLYRLGATPQQVRKGYVLAGPARSVASIRKQLHDKQLSRSVTLSAPPDGSRTIHFDTGFRWLHNPDERASVRGDLVEAVVATANAAVPHECALLPGAVRLDPKSAWREWVVGDDHHIGAVTADERRAIHSFLRARTPELIALTGRAGIDAHAEPLGSRRLADSGEHLAAREIATVANEHLTWVREELRRSTGIVELSAMDVHPFGPASPQTTEPSIAIRCLDGQAFVGTSIAQAVLLQAVAMAARRRFRSGVEERLLEQRTLEARRATAVLVGLDGRIRLDEPRHNQTRTNQRRGEQGRARQPRRASLESLAISLFESVVPELGTLEVTFEEFAPVAAWSVLYGRGSLARNDTELLARLSNKLGFTPATVIANPANHAPGVLLSAAELSTTEIDQASRSWDHSLSRPTPAVSRTRELKATPRSDARSRVAKLAALPEADPATYADQLVEAMAGLAPDEELVPWLGPASKNAVQTARRRLRPPGKRQFDCGVDSLKSGTRRVLGAFKTAEESGVALLRTTVERDARAAALAAAVALVTEGCPRLRLAISSVNQFKKDGADMVTVEVLIVRPGEAA